MTPTTIIREAQAEGVSLTISPVGNIKATGDGAAVNRWLAVIRARKAEIIDVLKTGAGDTANPLEVACNPDVPHAEILERPPDAIAAEPFTPTIPPPSAPMSDKEESAIPAWLQLVKESAPAIIAEVIERCRRDADARHYFTTRAAAELPKPDPLPCDLRTCSQCANYRQRVCTVARPERGALVIANRGYRPDPNRLLRCEGYAPLATESDQRTGAERWPGLLQKDNE